MTSVNHHVCERRSFQVVPAQVVASLCILLEEALDMWSRDRLPSALL